ncbi:MAG: hypothetical protein C4567_12475 [Deltaproteobacteria bacterium]|nr:MAG: hypothetical protein C4567_12475 [Deltaproteobacteria bacterium]
MPIKDEERIRRQGRMALLIHELDLLPGDYRPGDEELARAQELLTFLGAAVLKWQPDATIPEYEATVKIANEVLECLPGLAEVLGLHADATAADIKEACLARVQGSEALSKEVGALLAKVSGLEGELAQAREAAAKKGKGDKG